MKPDWDDAPAYLHSKKKPERWRMLVFIGIGSAITWALIALFAKPIVIDVEGLRQAIHFAEKPTQGVQLPVRQAPEPRKPETAQELLSQQRERQERETGNYIIRHDEPNAQEPAEQQPAGTPRQTSFNDSNYTPRTRINTIQAPKPVQYAANSSQHNQQPSRQNNSASWTWVGADRKPRPVAIQWITSDGWVEFDTVCHNHRRGSIEYRDCRKAAKEYFRHRCKTESRQAFCLAENRYYP